ncbi:hypothetical protein QVD17_25480 [Tagetes erecta]|uniref:Uncharacterized protein n=1 Tax=Tagetes erecta TaxID=13708 RepID=A0AAD8KJ75_TARER|nr:hypothetical protein QVD17_25480 [Tagetes erecta]
MEVTVALPPYHTLSAVNFPVSLSESVCVCVRERHQAEEETQKAKTGDFFLGCIGSERLASRKGLTESDIGSDRTSERFRLFSSLNESETGGGGDDEDEGSRGGGDDEGEGSKR